MLLIAIPIAWLTVTALVVAACNAASKGDARLLAATGEDGYMSGSLGYRSERRADAGARERQLKLPMELTPSH
ncbi:MAG TPA: hypothetical protein VMG62_04745 [Solirubrobacteraceae bacterium]|nr:hypothetical protein [Solirubrobacteraceae bacterium]